MAWWGHAPAMPGPLGPLRYLYVGTRDFEADLRYDRDTLGARLVWNKAAFGARVACFEVAAGPLLLIADHRPAPSVMPVRGVPDLDAAVRALRARGWTPSAGPFDIPDGPCSTFEDASGNHQAVFGEERLGVLQGAAGDG